MTLGWFGNILILLALLCLGRKWSIGWVFSILGNIIWCWYAIKLRMMDMLAIDGLCLLMAGFNLWAWTRPKNLITLNKLTKSETVCQDAEANERRNVK